MTRFYKSNVAAMSVILLIVVFVLPRPTDKSIFRMNKALFHQIKMNDRGPVKAPNEWFMTQRIWPATELDDRAVRRARQEAISMQEAGLALDEPWTFAGPSNVGGRITAMAVHPDNPNTIYVGGAIGGVLKSVDGGDVFTPIFDQSYSLSIGALAIDPADSNSIWIGTGEANSSGDSFMGNGVFVTRNGGDTWFNMGLENTQHIGRILVHPTDPNTIYVASMGKLFGTGPNRGVYKTTNGGVEWDRIFFIDDSTGCVDLEFDPINPDILYAVMWERVRRPHHRQVSGPGTGIWKTENGGNDWSELTNGLPDDDNLGRGSICVAPSDPNRLYAFFCNHPGYFYGAYRSDNGGDDWTELPAGNSDLADYLFSSFGWYFGVSEVDPNDPDVVYALGQYGFKSTDAGMNWGFAFLDSHVDHHALWINPNNSDHVMSGHDGGFNYSIDGGNTSSVHSDLPITQFYAITADPSHPERLYGGTQDNSTPRTLTGNTDDWDVIYWGDGFYCIVDPRDSDVIYACMQNGGIARSDDGGDDWYELNSDFWDDETNWMTPYILDPTNPDRLYLGTYRIWSSNNRGNDWTTISDDLTGPEVPGNLGLGTITSIGMSENNDQVIYAGSDNGYVWVTQMAGEVWTDISEGLPERWVTRVTVHPDSANIVYVCLSGYKYDEMIPHIYKSSNFGADWTPISGGLPDGPVNDLIIDPDNGNVLYVSTDYGVFITEDDGENWMNLGTGLPTSSVYDLHLVTVDNEKRLIAGTHGRSMWYINVGNVSNISENPSNELPSEFEISSYPNPFNASTNIKINTPQSGLLNVDVYDVLGRHVTTLASENVGIGTHQFSWNSMSSSGSVVSSGTYIVVAKQNGIRMTKRVVMVK